MVKSTGIARKIDKLGRVVIPKEIRKTLGMSTDKDFVEIFIEDDKIILKKYEPTCIFSGEVKETVQYKDKLVSKKCIQEMYSLLE